MKLHSGFAGSGIKKISGMEFFFVFFKGTSEETGMQTATKVENNNHKNTCVRPECH